MYNVYSTIHKKLEEVVIMRIENRYIIYYKFVFAAETGFAHFYDY